MITSKSAFTLIEMIIVIVVVGILAIFGTNIYITTYENYTMSSTVNKMQNHTELALAQIKNRLQYRIKESVIAFDPTGTALGTNGYVSLEQAGSDYSVLEWVGYDIDSFLGGDNNTTPDWNGFVDVAASKAAGIVTSPGSNFLRASNSIARLSNGVVNFPIMGAPSVIITFANDVPSARSFNWENGGTLANEVHPVSVASATTLNRTGGWVGQTVVEQYELSWTAYALVPNDPTTGDLSLYYNYRPWDGDTYQDVGVSHSLLAQHVSAFRFRQDGTAMQVQLCLDDDNITQKLSGQEGFAFCKEITIF